MSQNFQPQFSGLGVIQVPERYRDWSGNAEQLAALASEEIRRSSGVDPGISERLVRYYVTMGAVDRPRRAGKEALFGMRHLAQLLLLRRLLDQGLSLGNVRQMFQTVAWEFEQGQPPAAAARPGAAAPGASPISAPTAAQLLVESYLRDVPAVNPSPPPVVAGGVGSGPPATTAAGGARAAPAADARRLVELPVSPDCRALIEERSLRRLTPETARALAERLHAALLRALGQSSEGNQP